MQKDKRTYRVRKITLVEYDGKRREVELSPPIITNKPRMLLEDELCERYSKDGEVIVKVKFRQEGIWQE